MAYDRSILAYLKLLFGPFFRWWWAALTGILALLSFFAAPEDGMTVSRTGLLSAVIIGSMLLFLVVSVLVQSWALFRESVVDLCVVDMPKSKDHDAEYLVVLRGHIKADRGTILELRRPMGHAEGTFAFVELLDKTASGDYQAKPLWLSAGHRRDFAQGRFAASSLVVNCHIRRDQIQTIVDSRTS